MTRFSLTKNILGSIWIEEGIISNADGSFSKAFELGPIASGRFEEDFEGPVSDNFFSRLADLCSRLPNHFDGQIIFRRKKIVDGGIPGFKTNLYIFEKVPKPESYSHFSAIISELRTSAEPISRLIWNDLLEGYFGAGPAAGLLPDVLWESDCIKVSTGVTRVLSLTELPQLTWKACLQSVFENKAEFIVSLRLSVPDKGKIKRQLETKRRVSHAMSIASSLELRNIESNSVLNSSEETLERILVDKEALFEISLAIILHGDRDCTLDTAREFERLVSGVGNAGLFLEGVGSLPVLKSHLPGSKVFSNRKLPILSGNLCHLLPLFLDYSRVNDSSDLAVRSRNGEICTLNLFSKTNLNFNALVCGASGSGKSFLMNSLVTACLHREPKSRIAIFDIGGSYRRIIEGNGGTSTTLSVDEASALIATFLKNTPAAPDPFFKAFIETLCGSGGHITHSHRVAIEELLREVTGECLSIGKLVSIGAGRSESFYRDLAHWLRPHINLDSVEVRDDLLAVIRSPVAAFDFKALEGNPIIQRATILLLVKLIWRDLESGLYPRTLIAFDEVWKFLGDFKGLIEEFYRCLRKYVAGVASCTQSISDYGDTEFAKMIFSTSHTKIFLQAGASADYLRNTLDLSETDVERALSVASKKKEYSELFVLTPEVSQVLRLYATKDFYELANTEDITKISERKNA